MADIDENLCELQEEVVRTSIAKIKEAPKLAPCGRCYNCNDRLKKDVPLFCDIDCRDDYERINKKRT